MRIVHLSDIHYHPSQLKFNKFVIEPLVQDLKRMNEEKSINLILFTGDLIDRGGYDEKNRVPILNAFELFEENFIKPLINAIRLKKEDFIFIPGNHDIDRSKASSVKEKGLKSSLSSKEEIDHLMDNIKELDLERIADYKLYESVYYDEHQGFKSNDFGYSIIHTVNGKRVGIAGINSAWRCYNEEDKGNLIVGQKQIDAIDSSFEKETLDLKIALMHHAFDFLHPAETDYIKNSILRDYDLLLTGHTHSSSAYSITTSLGKGCILSTSPSNWEKNNYQNHTLYRNGYNIIDYLENTNEIDIYFRRYNYDKNQFISNTDLGEGDSAKSTFSLGTAQDKKNWSDYSKIIYYIKDHFNEEINQNLVSYNTDTRAPKDLKDLFVLPKIVRKNFEASLDQNGKKFSKEEEILDLEYLCTTENNLMLFGPTETGKTTILYRLATELVDKSATYKKIPIYIDLKGLSDKGLLRHMASFIGTTQKQLEILLSEQSFVLLLDNLRHIINHPISNELVSLINQYPRINVISTYDSISEQDKPVDFLNHPISKIFETANIQYFKSTEIQSLMQRWFQLDFNFEDDEKLNHLVKNFHNLNIPSTPLAVSMFLWIYEKQKEFRPVNNASMVQNFIEKLFEKHSPEEIYAGDFDFHNKDHLLSQIALEMYRQDQPNYTIGSIELQQFIKDLYKRKKMRVNLKDDYIFHEWVLEYFVKKGVLISENIADQRVYKFKLNCFFQYYLAKNMTFSKEFKDEVLNVHNYLMFEDEIDYYTGLSRYQEDILELVVTRMEERFESVLLQDEYKGNLFSLENFPFSFEPIFSVGKHKQKPIAIENFNEYELDEHLEKGKVTTEDKTNENDTLLDFGNDSTKRSLIPNKIPQGRMSINEILQKSWVLAAKVLKNSEELENGELKDRAFRSILICSLCLLSMHKFRTDQILEDYKKNPGEKDSDLASFYYFFSRFGLGIHEMLMHSVMGTSKLTPVIEDYLKKNLLNEHVSNVEKLTAVFLYIDSNADDYKTYLNLALQKNVTASVKDFVYLKLSMLHAATRKKDEEIYYRDKLNTLIKQKSKNSFVKSKQRVLSNHYKKTDKDKLIDELKKRQTSKTK